jgi:apolipoprotein N-acyltransferase
VRAGADVLINITNDGWFGRTAGPVQHAEMARMRAVECGVPVVRCANNGISFITDARGVVQRRAGLGERTVILDDVRPGRGDTTFLRHGLWPVWGFLLAWTAVVLVIVARGRLG